MKKILLGAGSEKSLQALKNILDSHIGAEVSEDVEKKSEAEEPETALFCLKEGAEIRRVLRKESVDLLILNTPLKEEQGIQLAGYAADTCGLPVIMMVGASTYDRTCEMLDGKGILILQRPMVPDDFIRSVRTALILSERIQIIRQERDRLSQKVEEIRLVDRAKAVLMNNLKMSEAQAHRYIEKQAMDLRVSRREIAQNLLKIYYRK